MFKSYTSFDFIYTYTRYRLKIIKLWWHFPLKITKSFLKQLKCSYFNIEESEFLSKASLAVF